ncbi:Hypothetical protein NTJ_01204 [Nesidiocoris tenuis]|uniref:Uncharacterized protein n=1 Tax=Nesidiocoris tenuis TaxID=355587 RepID=A0ABN7A8V1_9HEMI|nr:Hypothetical protein NTJ_01204 [Nesidiocoris tenuis]
MKKRKKSGIEKAWAEKAEGEAGVARLRKRTDDESQLASRLSTSQRTNHLGQQADRHPRLKGSRRAPQPRAVGDPIGLLLGCILPLPSFTLPF